MRFGSLSAVLAVSNVLLGVSAGPLLAVRQDDDTSESSSLTTSATSTAPTVALVVGTLSNGDKTTYQQLAPEPTESATGSGSLTATPTKEAPVSTLTYTPTGLPAASTSFPHCDDANARPFCLPANGSELYVGKTYYATWNPDFFPLNSTVIVKVEFSNDSSQQVWSSPKTQNSWGFVAVETTKEWMQGYSMFNLTFTALNIDNENPGVKAKSYDGPSITIMNEPPRHLPPSNTTKIQKEGLMIGLPVGLGALFIVVAGTYFGMRKHRTIGLGNIMGRRNRGYGVGKSRRQRLGLGKKGAIALEEREIPGRTRERANSLGSLVSDDDEIRPAPRGNQFRDEIQRQQTGR